MTDLKAMNDDGDLFEGTKRPDVDVNVSVSYKTDFAELDVDNCTDYHLYLVSSFKGDRETIEKTIDKLIEELKAVKKLVW